MHGLASVVQDDDGHAAIAAPCAGCSSRSAPISGTSWRPAIASGFGPTGRKGEGFIERIEPRHGVLSRTSRGRQQVIVANVDQLLIVGSAAEPLLKPHLIDRMLVTAEKARIRPVICINKIDLVDPADLQPLIGVYGQMGYQVLLLSRDHRLRCRAAARVLANQQSVVAGQSGVGKSSLLNAIEPQLAAARAHGQRRTQKGRHTTTTAQLIPLVLRRLRRRHAGHPAVPAVGRHPRRSGRLLPRPAAVRQPLPLSGLHAHA